MMKKRTTRVRMEKAVRMRTFIPRMNKKKLILNKRLRMK
jgi:hypothetical protein